MSQVTKVLGTLAEDIFAPLSISEQQTTALLELFSALLVVGIIMFIIYYIIKKISLRRAKTKQQISNVMMLLRIVKYLFIFLIILIFIIIQYGSLSELGLVAGLLTVALGFALRQPLTSMVAWAVIVVRRPFFIGDRISIGEVKGDITDLSLTSMFIKEIGGTIDGEERSERIVVIPNLRLFETEIVNYTAQHQYILDEVTVAVTYESDLGNAERIVASAVNKILGPWREYLPDRISKEPHTRLKFQPSGIDVTVRYYVPARKRNEFSTDITREIFNKI
ncbi:MAG: mechanosensitive ion channel domain-containing protein, partial [Thermoplasmatota archaeon]